MPSWVCSAVSYLSSFHDWSCAQVQHAVFTVLSCTLWSTTSAGTSAIAGSSASSISASSADDSASADDTTEDCDYCRTDADAGDSSGTTGEEDSDGGTRTRECIIQFSGR